MIRDSNKGINKVINKKCICCNDKSHEISTCYHMHYILNNDFIIRKSLHQVD